MTAGVYVGASCVPKTYEASKASAMAGWYASMATDAGVFVSIPRVDVADGFNSAGNFTLNIYRLPPGGGSVKFTRPSAQPSYRACVIEEELNPFLRLPSSDFGLVAASLAGLILSVYSFRYVRAVVARYRDPA